MACGCCGLAGLTDCCPNCLPSWCAECGACRAHCQCEVVLREDIDAWFRKLPSTLDGLPQTFELDDQVCYRDQTGAVVDGVVVATVTYRERYVVAPGDSRTDKREPMFMIDVSRIVRRGETPPLPGGEKA